VPRAQIDTNPQEYKYIIVGSGLYGLTMAERIANVLHEKVLIIEKREVVGGNAYAYLEPTTGIEVHKFGSHIFHTSNAKVWNYVNEFTSFNNYRHRVIAIHRNSPYVMPINLMTINSFLGTNYGPSEAARWLQANQQTGSENSFQASALKAIGSELYEAFYRGYTQKQWQIDPQLLPSETFKRLPIRFNYNSDYFTDKWQGIPSHGFSQWFENMIKNPLIDVSLNANFFGIRSKIRPDQVVIYTGPIDEYFNFKYGRLGWRTTDFEVEVLNVVDYQGNSVVNYCDLEVPFTRIHEFKHFHPELYADVEGTVIMREYSRVSTPSDDPYYPINSPADREKLYKYRRESKTEKNVIFGGRLGTYQYLDMHMAIAAALSDFENNLLFASKR